MEMPINTGGSGGADSTDVTASSAQVLAGYTAITTDSNDEPKEGTISSKAAATYGASIVERTIPAGRYLAGAQTIKAVTTDNLTAANVKDGVNVTVGDQESAGRIANVTGSYTEVSSGQSPVVAGAMLSGYSAFANGSAEVQGSIPSKAAATYNTSTSDQTIASGQYLSGSQVIKAVKTNGVVAQYVKKGVVVKVGDANDAGRIKNITGTYTTISDGNTAVTAPKMLSGYSAFANGSAEIKGTIPSKAAATYTPGTSNQTIAAGQYLSGVQTISGDADLVAGNIISGKSIFGVAGSFVNGAQRFKTGTITSSSGTSTFSWQEYSVGAWQTATSTSANYITISDLGFSPTYMYLISTTTATMQLGDYYWWAGGYWYAQRQTGASGTLGLLVHRYVNTGNLKFTSSQVLLPTGNNPSTSWRYYLG